MIVVQDKDCMRRKGRGVEVCKQGNRFPQPQLALGF